MPSNKASVGSCDRQLRAKLAAYGSGDSDFWSFRGNAAREHAHAYFQYPAMMVPQMQGELLRAVSGACPHVRNVYDPFVGSGTTLTESMLLGMNFGGRDINPLAVLLCRAKAIPYFTHAIAGKITQVRERVRHDKGRRLEARFPGRCKWFRQDVSIALSRIRRAIRKEPSRWARQFFWVAMAETVRLTSNSRTSTFKLHIRPEQDIRTREIRTVDLFESLAKRNLQHLIDAKNLLSERELLERGRYRGRVEIKLGDSRRGCERSEEYDLVLTSPPYGDNVTTIPYGQHSYLPLQWIDLEDIDDGVDESYLQTTHEIDTRSLGGSRRFESSEMKRLRGISRAFADTVRGLRKEAADRTSRVTAFCRDLDGCLDPVLSSVKKHGYLIWIVGNRMVAGRPMPLARIFFPTCL